MSAATRKPAQSKRQKREELAIVCFLCKAEIVGPDQLRDSVRLSQGQVHGECSRKNWNGIVRQIEQATADGTHDNYVRRVCHFCRNVVEVVWVRTFDGKDMCVTCAAEREDASAKKFLARKEQKR